MPLAHCRSTVWIAFSCSRVYFEWLDLPFTKTPKRIFRFKKCLHITRSDLSIFSARGSRYSSTIHVHDVFADHVRRGKFVPRPTRASCLDYVSYIDPVCLIGEVTLI